jgi:predicted DNA-binding transcriptional regulator AlpA
MPNFDDFPNSALVRLKDLLAPYGPLPISKSTLWSWCKSGRFPQPVRVAPRVTAWRVGEIRAFLAGLEPSHAPINNRTNDFLADHEQEP